MSVINKMLRDLDNRQVVFGEEVSGQTMPQRATTAQPVGIFSVSAAPFAQSRAKSKRSGWLALCLLLMGTGIASAWWVWARPTTLPTIVQAPTPPTPSVETALVEPTATPGAIQAPSSVAASLPVATKTASAPRATPLESLRLESSTPLSLKMDVAPPRRKQAQLSTAPERTVPAPSDTPKTAASTEILEQAQALWSAGSRDAAQELLQEAIATAERRSSTSAQSNPSLLALVRELTRMQLADARYGAVWDLLTRLEPQLGSQPDLWAIRANAAQRLGRHQDSVHAYLVALQARPHEQRWLLGTAVSLAALGQTASAGEMADKARAVGGVSPDVLAYLRQMGVPLTNK